MKTYLIIKQRTKRVSKNGIDLGKHFDWYCYGFVFPDKKIANQNLFDLAKKIENLECNNWGIFCSKCRKNKAIAYTTGGYRVYNSKRMYLSNGFRVFYSSDDNFILETTDTLAVYGEQFA